ncbi:MAG: hypothetical protein JKY88_04310 [Pseudomonadales bacterium]|nr:hypothetical protein [Pseudomonadales bacterium]
MTDNNGKGCEDLGFTFLKNKEGFTLLHHNKVATILRGRKAQKFEIDIEYMDFSGQQHLMARLTGNYKRGNEKALKNRNSK